MTGVFNTILNSKKLLMATSFIVCCHFLFSQEIAQKIEAENFDNLYKISPHLYRSEQPSKKGMKELEKLGVVTVLNLRNRTNDKHEAKSTSLQLQRVAINAWKMDNGELLEALKIIKNTDAPVVVHCLHGSDRTGVVIAAYRIVFQNWSKDDAIKEFLEPKFGFHAKWFQNLKQLLLDLDENAIKKELGFR